MKDLIKITFIREKQVKGEGDKKKDIFTFIATEEVIDRDGDIVIVNGLDTEMFEKNPVVLWSHNASMLPIGKVVKIRKQDKKVLVDIEFADTEDGQKVQELVKKGYLNAVSIRFSIKEGFSDKYDWLDGVESLDKLKESYEDIYNELYKQDVLRSINIVITKSELLEVSVVNIPANQNALVVMRSKGFTDIKYLTLTPEGRYELVGIDDVVEFKSVVSFKHPSDRLLDTETSWNRDKAVKSLRAWASEDGSGDKDKMNWTKYRQGFTWYDKGKVDNFTSYKYPHHFVNEDGKFVTSWRGVATAMAFFMKNKDDLPEEDVQGVYNHLAKHYKEFDKDVPELKSYTIDEFRKVFGEDIAEIVFKENVKEVFMELDKLNELINIYEKEISQLKEEVKELNIQLKQIQEEKSSSHTPKQGVSEENDKSIKEEDILYKFWLGGKQITILKD